MRVKQIKVEGEKRGVTVELTRDGNNVIAVVRQDGQTVGNAHIVGVRQRKNLEEMARQIQHAADGYAGTHGDVAGYQWLIDILAS